MKYLGLLCVSLSSSKLELKNPYTKLQRFIYFDVLCKHCRTIEEVIARANSTQYGLAAGVATKDLNIANTVSRSIRAGIVWINCYLAFDADSPYGGYKMSGFGRDFGMDALYKYLQVKSVVTPVHNSPWL